MANLQRILGSMLLSRMGGRGRMGGALGTAALMGLGGRRGGLGRKAGFAALAYLAYRAYQDRGRTGADAGPEAGTGQQRTLGGTIGGIIDSLTGPARGGQGGGGEARPSLGERIGDALGRGASTAPADADAGAVSDGRALLLIRAMIAAANSDGRISEEERQRILSKLAEAGSDAEDQRTVERELANPVPLDTLLAEVKDQDTAQQFYLASRVAVEGETGVQKSYLEFLRQRLNLPEEDVAEAEELTRG